MQDYRNKIVIVMVITEDKAWVAMVSDGTSHIFSAYKELLK